MSTARLATRFGRAAALAMTACVLLATSVATPGPYTLDAATSCGPAGRIRLDPGRGCGGDPTWDVVGGPEVGLPRYAEEAGGDKPDEFVLAGEVDLPGAAPPLSVMRVCRLSAEVNGVRAIACEGDAPESACSGTLTAVPEAR